MAIESEIPCVLVVDDDAITLRFFEAAFREIGLRCVTVVDGAAATAAIVRQTFHLLLIDRHLPDTNGPALLKTLRDAGMTAPAIATSAEIDTKIRSALIDAGFADVIAKPTDVRNLRNVVAKYVTLAAVTDLPLLDDGAALGALGGNVDSLAALRRLLADELDAVLKTYSNATTIDPNQLDTKLHRLRASCGFCGATALAEAAKTLQSSLHDRTRDHVHDVSAFLKHCTVTTRSLRERPTAHR